MQGQALIERHHRSAMAISDSADDWCRHFQPTDEAGRKVLDHACAAAFALASQAEAKAAELATEEPSRAVLYRSAATMAH